MSKENCKLENCSAKHHAKGYCQKHYRRMWREKRKGIEERGRLIDGLKSLVRIALKERQWLEDLIVHGEYDEAVKYYPWYDEDMLEEMEEALWHDNEITLSVLQDEVEKVSEAYMALA